MNNDLTVQFCFSFIWRLIENAAMFIHCFCFFLNSTLLMDLKGVCNSAVWSNIKRYFCALHIPNYKILIVETFSNFKSYGWMFLLSCSFWTKQPTTILFFAENKKTCTHYVTDCFHVFIVFKCVFMLFVLNTFLLCFKKLGYSFIHAFTAGFSTLRNNTQLHS